jgi:hypothetical protein
MDLTRGWYFDGMNISEALAQELAGAWHDDTGPATTDNLPFRDLSGTLAIFRGAVRCPRSPRSPS